MQLQDRNHRGGALAHAANTPLFALRAGIETLLSGAVGPLTLDARRVLTDMLDALEPLACGAASECWWCGAPPAAGESALAGVERSRGPVEPAEEGSTRERSGA